MIQVLYIDAEAGEVRYLHLRPTYEDIEGALNSIGWSKQRNLIPDSEDSLFVNEEQMQNIGGMEYGFYLNGKHFSGNGIVCTEDIYSLLERPRTSLERLRDLVTFE